MMVDILHKHQDRLIICLGAHIHHVHVMAPMHPLYDDLNIVQVISPAISPIYMNNPGYGQMTFSVEKGVENLLFRFFQLEDFQSQGVIDFVEYDLMRFTGVDLNHASTVRTYINSLFYNFQAYAGYLARNMGLRGFLAQGSQFFWPFVSQLYSEQTD